MKIYYNYLKVCKKRINKISWGSILLLINTIIAIKLPLLLNNSVNYLFKYNEGKFNDFIKLFLFYIVLFTIQNIVNFFSTIWFKKIGNETAGELANNIVDKIIDAEKRNPSQVNIKDAMIVLTGDIFNLGESGILLLYRFLYTCINLMVMLYYMKKANVLLSILVIIILLILLFLQRKINKIIGIKIIEIKKTFGEYYYVTDLIVNSSEEHRRNGAREYIKEKYKSNIAYLLLSQLDLTKINRMVQLLNSGAVIIIEAIIFLLGGNYVSNGKMLLSELVTFNMFASKFSNYLSALPNIWIQKKEFDISCNRVNDMLDITTYQQYSDNDKLHISNYLGLEKVSFGYENGLDSIIKNFTHIFYKDKMYCIFGSNGCGKSTLISILNGDNEVTDGKIYLDKLYINPHKQKDKIDHLQSTFSSNSVLYNDTIKNNILLGRNISNEKVEFICKMLCMNEWLGTLKLGMDTTISELKDNLSDGQKQKISLARFFIETNQVIILDEFEKNLDKETRESIINYLSSIKNNHIIIMVSHDSFIASRCDEVINM